MAAPLQSDYQIISDPFLPSLLEQVNAELGKGYILSGGITYVKEVGSYDKYYQILVKPVAPSAGGRRRSTRRRR
jgi:hypothetical protein